MEPEWYDMVMWLKDHGFYIASVDVEAREIVLRVPEEESVT